MHSNWLSLCLNFVCLSVSHVMGKSAMISCFLPSLYWNHFRLIIRRSSIFQIQWKLDWKGMLCVCVCCVARSFISQAWISDSKKLRVAKSKWEVCYAFKSKLLYWWGGNLPHLCIWLVRYIREKFEEMMMSCLGVWFSSWASSLNDTSYYIWKLPLALFKITFLRSLQRRSSSVSRICMQQCVFFRAL